MRHAGVFTRTGAIVDEQSVSTFCGHTSARRTTAMQRLLSVGRERRVHGVGHIAIVEALGAVPVDRPVLKVLRTFSAGASAISRGTSTE